MKNELHQIRRLHSIAFPVSSAIKLRIYIQIVIPTKVGIHRL